MAYALKSKDKSRLSLKKARTPISAYRYAITSRNIILWVIVIAAVIVCITAISTIFLKPERRVQSDLETLARDYYENVFYQDLVTSDNFDGSAAEALDRYQDTGLAPLTLRQLSAIAPDSATNYLLEQCDEEATTVKFFPESPYSRTSYHVDYTYSCNY